MGEEKLDATNQDMKCPACGKKNVMTLDESCPQEVGGKLIEYAFYRCPACDSSQVLPIIPAPPDFYNYDEGDFDFGRPEDRWEFGEFAQDMERRFPEGGAVLEIGSGEGAMLQRLDPNRFRRVGVDINKRAIEVARQKGIDCFCCDLKEFVETIEYQEKEFDAIAFFHVLEHLVDPSKFIADVSAQLKTGGMIAFSVPNEDRIMLSVGREIWDYPPNHLHRYSQKGLEALLERSGFKVLKIEDHPRNMSFFRFWSFYAYFLQRKFGIHWTYDSAIHRAIRMAGKIPFFALGFPPAVVLWCKNHRRGGLARYVLAKPN
ncbi:MAG: class I SAM-dependent methyltransferase [Pirellulales bacterium]|nr:class I SAM-dependent methyltransferase [Pirellulales bacterium]